MLIHNVELYGLLFWAMSLCLSRSATPPALFTFGLSIPGHSNFRGISNRSASRVYEAHSHGSFDVPWGRSTWLVDTSDDTLGHPEIRLVNAERAECLVMAVGYVIRITVHSLRASDNVHGGPDIPVDLCRVTARSRLTFFIFLSAPISHPGSSRLSYISHLPWCTWA